jgi:predicted MFS family arabinose efflux permease
LRVLPLTVLIVLGAPAANMAQRRYGPRAAATTGSVLVVLGILGMAGLTTADAWATSATFAVLGLGFATVMVTATGTVVGDAPPGYAGVVGGLKQTAMNIGPTIGITVAASAMQASSRTTTPALR